MHLFKVKAGFYSSISLNHRAQEQYQYFHKNLLIDPGVSQMLRLCPRLMSAQALISSHLADPWKEHRKALSGSLETLPSGYKLNRSIRSGAREARMGLHGAVRSRKGGITIPGAAWLMPALHPDPVEQRCQGSSVS